MGRRGRLRPAGGFGVGQSSLSQLHELPLDILKIDRTFISQITDRDDEPDLGYGLARPMKAEAVADIVEAPDRNRDT